MTAEKKTPFLVQLENFSALLMAHTRDFKKSFASIICACAFLTNQKGRFRFLYDWLLFETYFVVYPAKKALKLDTLDHF